jgi:hypothetical protein
MAYKTSKTVKLTNNPALQHYKYKGNFDYGTENVIVSRGSDLLGLFRDNERLCRAVNSHCRRFMSRQGFNWKFIVDIYKFLFKLLMTFYIIISWKCSDLVEIITRKGTIENCQCKCKFNCWHLWLCLRIKYINTSRLVLIRLYGRKSLIKVLNK